MALARQNHSYKALRATAEQLLAQTISTLDAMQPQLPLAMPSSSLTQQHDLIRPTTEYAEFFQRRVHDQDATTVTSADPPCAR